MAAVGESDNPDIELLKRFLLTHYDRKESWSTRNIIKLYVVLLYLANNILEGDKRREEWEYLHDLLGNTSINKGREKTLLTCINRLIKKIIFIIKIKYLIPYKRKYDLTHLKNAITRILIKLGWYTKNGLINKEYDKLIMINPWDIVEYVLEYLNHANIICYGELQIGFSFDFDDIKAKYTEWYTEKSLETKTLIDKIKLYKPDQYDSTYKRIITTYIEKVNLEIIKLFIESYSSFVLPKEDAEVFLKKKYNERMAIYKETIATEEVNEIETMFTSDYFYYFDPFSIGTLIIQEIKRLVNSTEDLSNAATPGGNRRKTRHRKNHKARTATKSHKIRHNKTRTKSRR